MKPSFDAIAVGEHLVSHRWLLCERDGQARQAGRVATGAQYK